MKYTYLLNIHINWSTHLFPLILFFSQGLTLFPKHIFCLLSLCLLFSLSYMLVFVYVNQFYQILSPFLCINGDESFINRFGCLQLICEELGQCLVIEHEPSRIGINFSVVMNLFVKVPNT
jgi:hypothetical protein